MSTDPTADLLHRDAPKRPHIGHNGSVTSTPSAADSIELLGGKITEGVALTRDQLRAIRRVYGYTEETPNVRPAPPVQPETVGLGYFDRQQVMSKYEEELRRHAKWEDPREFMQSGADRNMFRDMSTDGMRVMAWLAQHLTPGEDPVKTVINMAVAAGWDVSCEDGMFAQEEDGQ
jgi:hypothetical protein